MTLASESRKAVKAAKAAGFLGDSDAGTIAGLLNVAKMIDERDKQHAEHRKLLGTLVLAGTPAHELPSAPPWDNTLIGSYLKYQESLGLSPNGRKAFNAASPAASAPGAPSGADEVSAMRRRHASGR